MKGAALSKTIYMNPSIRISGDIDILIHPKNLDALNALLISHGFKQGKIVNNRIQPFTRKELLFHALFTHQVAPYVKNIGNPLWPYINIDVNIDIMWGEYEGQTDMEYVLTQAQQTSLFEFPVQTFIPPMEFIALCLHHYKDMNSLYLLSRGSLRIGAFCDIYDYLRFVKPSFTEVHQLSHILGVEPYINACLKLTNILFGDPLILDYIIPQEETFGMDLSDFYGLNDKERKTWNIDIWERLFHPNLPKYIREQLTEDDLKKIKINSILM